MGSWESWFCSVLVAATILAIYVAVICYRDAGWVSRYNITLSNELRQAQDMLKEQAEAKTYSEHEKQARVYYQNIVYEVAVELDRLLQRQPGQGVVCGTSSSPSAQVQETVARLVQEVTRSPALHVHLRTVVFPQEDN